MSIKHWYRYRGEGQLDVQLIDIPESNGFDFRTLLKLKKIIKKFSPDVIHPHDYKTNFLTVLSRPRACISISTCHGYVAHDSKLNLYYKIDQFSLKRMGHIVVVSEEIRSQVIKMGVEPRKVTLVHNGIDCKMFNRTRGTSDAKSPLGFSQDRLLIGAVGRLSAEKGFHLLIAACENLIEAGHNIELAFLGEGDQRQALGKQIAESKYSDRFHLLGYQADTISYFEAMDMYVLSSFSEGLPNVVLEAMAMEVPVVATRVGGVPNLISDGIHGVLVDSGNVEALQQGIQRALQDETLRTSMVKNARERVENEFSFENRMAQVSQLYDQLLTGR